MRDLGLACLIGVLGAGAIFALGQAICAAGLNPFEPTTTLSQEERGPA